MGSAGVGKAEEGATVVSALTSIGETQKYSASVSLQLSIVEFVFMPF